MYVYLTIIYIYVCISHYKVFVFLGTQKEREPLGKYQKSIIVELVISKINRSGGCGMYLNGRVLA